MSLIFRKPMGAGTPREWNNRVRIVWLLLLGIVWLLLLGIVWLLVLGQFSRRHEHNRRCRSMILRSRKTPAEATSITARHKSC